MTSSRRTWAQQAFLAAGVVTTHISTSLPSRAHAAEGSKWSTVKAPIEEATDTLVKLLQNWERAVIDCTYADVPRELLEQKNKELLLEKASTYALFDKSVSVVSCKTRVTIVRDYLGRTGIGPLVDLNNNLKTAVKLLLQDDAMAMDEIDVFVQMVEDLQRELTRADSLSYSARRDFSSMNNFDPSLKSEVLADPGSDLQQCKTAIQAAVAILQIILESLPND